METRKLMVAFHLFCSEEFCHSDFCMDAHSEDELKEWQDRCSYRDKKKSMAIELNIYIYDYIDSLREQHFHSGCYPVSLQFLMRVFFADHDHKWRYANVR